jgi:hypothetical protein
MYRAPAEALGPGQLQTRVSPQLSDTSDRPLDPGLQIVAGELTSCNTEDRALGLVDGTGKLVTVKNEERLEGCMPHPLVAVNEWVILYQGIGERRGLGYQICVKTSPSKVMRG